MATQTKDDVGGTWTDLVTELSLVSSSTYIIQNVSSYPLNFKEKSSLPDSSEYGHIITPGMTWTFTVGTDGIYVRNQGTDKLINIAVTLAA